MRILIVGAGGIGGYFGARLIQAGADITFLLREQRNRLIRSKGLGIETPAGHFSVQPASVTADQLKPDYDLIMLAPKAYDLDDSLTSLAGAGERGVLLPLLNGYTHLARLDQRFGRARVMGGVAHIAAMITDTGAVRQLSELHMITVGPRDPAHVDLAREFIGLCGQAAFDSRYTDDIDQALWDKWTFLAALAALTTLCHGPVGEIVATRFGKASSLAMHDECCAIAAACGHPIEQAVRAKAAGLLTQPGSGFTASMLRDLSAGQATEHEHILGELIRLGEAQGIQSPLLGLAHTQLAVLANRAAARS